MRPPTTSSSTRPRSTSLKNSTQPIHQNRWPRADPNLEIFELIRPRDGMAELVVNEMFDDMMNRRELASLPPNAKQDMLNFSIDKKWTLIYNDRYTEWYATRQKRLNSDSTPTKRSNILESSPALGQPSSSSASHLKHDKATGHGMWRQSGSSSGHGKREEPEWYIKKFMDRTADHRVVAALAVALRTHEITWLQEFIHLKGQIVLTNSLEKINAPGAIRKESDLITDEYETLKCLKILLNSKQGANDAISHPESIYQILFSLVSPHLPTRKTVADILTLLCHWDKPRGHSHVLKGLDQLATMKIGGGKTIGKTMARFDAWFGTFEQVIDGRGKMGSLVGASDELRSLRGHSITSNITTQDSDTGEMLSTLPSSNSHIGIEGALNEYALANLFLITSIISIPEDVTVRVHLRSQMNSSGLRRIMDKLRKFQHNSIERQLNQIEVETIKDEEEMLESVNHRMLNDRTNPQQLFDTLRGQVVVKGRRIRCKMCRRELAAREHILVHSPGKGQSAFAPQKQDMTQFRKQVITPSLRNGQLESGNSPTKSNEDVMKKLRISLPPQLKIVPTEPPTFSVEKETSPTNEEKDKVLPMEPLIKLSMNSSSGSITTTTTPLIESENCSSYFVEPLSWMNFFLEDGQLMGKIICPNLVCKSKLGSFDWAGSQCSCGTWVTPGFQILRSKVDEL